MVFDSWFDPYRGVVVLVRVVDGVLRRHMRIRLWSTGLTYEVEDLGVRTPKPVAVEELAAGGGGFGFVTPNIKRVAGAKAGDTLTDDEQPAAAPLPGFTEIKPMVFAGL